MIVNQTTSRGERLPAQLATIFRREWKMAMEETGVEGSPYSAAWCQSLRKTLGDVVCREMGIYAIPDHWRISVVMPIYNERDTIRTVIDRVKAVPIRKELILVEDCSQDGTQDILRQIAAEAQANPDPNNEIVVVFHDVNQGKGAAVRTVRAGHSGAGDERFVRVL